MFSVMKKMLFNFYVETWLIGCQLANTKLSDTLILALILVFISNQHAAAGKKERTAEATIQNDLQ